MAITVRQALNIGGLREGRLLKRDFLQDMLSGGHHSVEALLARSRWLGWDLANKRAIMLVDLNQ